MYLRRITVTGFKSFAGRTVLDLEAGMTAVVGPNGSGKSNLADAIRWALGEQNKGRLRVGDREQVVFAGSAGRARASYAEVVLLFNNDDHAFPLDLTEVEISRRLYRSGETDYRLAGRSVRLSDIQLLMAQAGFGANSYAVIGQGTIDSFLLSSPTERKLLFDEAAGIRGPELKREAALRQLAGTATNLTRLRDIAAELAPRLESLAGAVAASEGRERLMREVAQLRQRIINASVEQASSRLEGATDRLRLVTVDAHRLRHDQRAMEARLAAHRRQLLAAQAKRDKLQGALAELEAKRDAAAGTLTEARAALADARRRIDLAAAVAVRQETAVLELARDRERQHELEAELATNRQAAERADKAVAKMGAEVAAAQTALVELRHSASSGSRDQYIDNALSLLKTLAITLDDPQVARQEIRLLVHKTGRLLSHATRAGAADILAALETSQTKLEAAMTKRETAIEHQTNITITRRSLEIDLVHQRDATARSAELSQRIEAELAVLAVTPAQLERLETATETAGHRLGVLTTQLETEREAVRTAGDTVATDTGDMAAATERLRVEVLGAAAESRALATARTIAQADLVAARTRAHEWGLTAAPTERHATELSQLEAALIRAEAELAAKTSLHDSQAAEYAAVDTRHTELTDQITDLEHAERDLQQVITELNVLIQDRFRTNFQALAEQFSQNFARLFQGGAASLELIETDEGAYGIVIKATPKGKRLTALAALSGGERALAGVALLAAILAVNPSPFVVLDEVDAALDEANSGRLAEILGELQERSQLIVITHNRQTMKAARVLFGVTMNEQHVSHLLSMRLEEATTLAAR